MRIFLRCVAEAVSEHGVRGLVGLVPGGEFAWNVAVTAYNKYRTQLDHAAAREEVSHLARAGVDEARRVAAEVAREVAGRASPEDRASLELYLTQVPGATRRSLSRPEDPSGKTVPSGFVLSTAEDVARLLPDHLPPHRPGARLREAPAWELVQLLGEGGFGQVWLAQNTDDTRQRAAVKFCHPDHAKALRHEARLIRRLEAGRFERVVRLLHAELSGEHPWLMYEYVPKGPDGRDLGDRILAAPGESGGRRVRDATAAFREVCQAVAGVHRLGIVHRDLKPANILIDGATSRLVVADFGIGYATTGAAVTGPDPDPATTGLTTYLRGKHTPIYASEQQQAGEYPDVRDDVHALGVIAFQLLTGQLARGPGSDFREELGKLRVPPPLVALIGECVARDPQRRPADAGEVLRRLDDTGIGRERGASQARPPTAPRRTKDGSRFRADFNEFAPGRDATDHPPVRRRQRGPDVTVILAVGGAAFVLLIAMGGVLWKLTGTRSVTAPTRTDGAEPAPEFTRREGSPSATPPARVIPTRPKVPEPNPSVVFPPKANPKIDSKAVRPKVPDPGLPMAPPDVTAPPADQADVDRLIVQTKAADAATRDQGAGGLIPYLTHADVAIRRRAARALAEMGAEAVIVAPALRQAVQDSDIEVRRAARVALDAITAAESAAAAAKTRDAILGLAKDFSAKDTAKRITAFNAVALYGSEANIVGDKLIEAMSDRSPTVRNAASEALARVNPKVHPHVMTILYGQNKQSAFASLGQLKGEAAISVPLLLSCQGELFRTGRIAGQPTFGAIGAPFHAIADIAPRDKRFAEVDLPRSRGVRVKGVDSEGGAHQWPARPTPASSSFKP